MHYVKITNASFLPGLLSDGDVWPCNIVTAKWVCDEGYGFYSNSSGVAASTPWPDKDVPAPTLESGAVENAAASDVVINFSAPLAVTNSTGMTVEVDSVGATISGVVVSGDTLTVTLSAPVANGEAVTFAYNGATGNLTASGEGNAAVATIATTAMTNNVLP